MVVDGKSGILEDTHSPASEAAYNCGSRTSSESLDGLSFSTTVSGEIGGDGMIDLGARITGAGVGGGCSLHATDENEALAMELALEEPKLSWRIVSGGESRDAIGRYPLGVLISV